MTNNMNILKNNLNEKNRNIDIYILHIAEKKQCRNAKS